MTTNTHNDRREELENETKELAAQEKALSLVKIGTKEVDIDSSRKKDKIMKKDQKQAGVTNII